MGYDGASTHRIENKFTDALNVACYNERTNKIEKGIGFIPDTPKKETLFHDESKGKKFNFKFFGSGTGFIVGKNPSWYEVASFCAIEWWFLITVTCMMMHAMMM